MSFFKSVFADETTPPDSPKSPTAAISPHPQEDPSDSAPWSFGGFFKNLATKSESVIDTYRRDLQELGSGLKKETAVIRDVASRSFEAGASVAQESLESVGQAIDDIGSTVWKSTAQIVSHGTDSILVPHLRDHDRIDSVSNSSSNQRNLNLDVKRYSRFEMQVRAVQCDLNTYCSVPEDKEDYDKWRSESFMLEERGEEIERLRSENGVISEIYNEAVPSRVDNEGFWSRYFYRVHKLKQAEEARALLVKRAISAEEEEDLSWDFDDDDEGIDKEKAETSRNVELGNSVVTEGKIENLSERVSSGDKNSDGKKVVAAAAVAEGKGDNGESCKDSDVSVVSSQSVPEEEDLGWDQIEDVGSDDEVKREEAGSSRSASGLDIRKRLNSEKEEEEELSWDIEDEDDDSAKP